MEEIEEIHEVSVPEVFEGVGMGSALLHPFYSRFLAKDQQLQTIDFLKYRSDFGFVLDEESHQRPNIVDIEDIILIS